MITDACARLLPGSSPLTYLRDLLEINLVVIVRCRNPVRFPFNRYNEGRCRTRPRPPQNLLAGPFNSRHPCRLTTWHLVYPLCSPDNLPFQVAAFMYIDCALPGAGIGYHLRGRDFFVTNLWRKIIGVRAAARLLHTADTSGLIAIRTRNRIEPRVITYVDHAGLDRQVLLRHRSPWPRQDGSHPEPYQALPICGGSSRLYAPAELRWNFGLLMKVYQRPGYELDGSVQSN
ncbi:hypothetical protein GA0074694_3792 [Micromonospora inyonensis]|uniref:Uncharacterized protein n=1 Tax=Micromonospora inyonensis TaxID=47866 RepID=A0A1C6S392_9ACTN|nr:hypothetical protein GA0074694_3792 [Micromonospora inyonensis]